MYMIKGRIGEGSFWDKYEYVIGVYHWKLVADLRCWFYRKFQYPQRVAKVMEIIE